MEKVNGNFTSETPLKIFQTEIFHYSLIRLMVDFETDTSRDVKETSGRDHVSVNWPSEANNLKIADLLAWPTYQSITFDKMISIQIVDLSEYEKHYKRLPTHMQNSRTHGGCTTLNTQTRA